MGHHQQVHATICLVSLYCNILPGHSARLFNLTYTLNTIANLRNTGTGMFIPHKLDMIPCVSMHCYLACMCKG